MEKAKARGRYTKISKAEYDYLKSIMNTGMTPYEASKFVHRSDSTMSYVKRTEDYKDYQQFLERKSIAQKIQRAKSKPMPLQFEQVSPYKEIEHKEPKYTMYDDAVTMALADMKNRISRLEKLDMPKPAARPVVAPTVIQPAKTVDKRGAEIKRYKTWAIISTVLLVALILAIVYLYI